MIGIKTTVQREAFQGYLELLTEALFEKKKDFEKTLEKRVPLPYSGLIKARMIEHKITVGEKSKIKILLKQLENELNTLSPIGLTIAFKAQDSSIDRLYSWIDSRLGGDLILDLSIDPGIIGGAVISYQGRYANYSLKKKLERISLKNIVKTAL